MTKDTKKSIQQIQRRMNDLIINLILKGVMTLQNLFNLKDIFHKFLNVKTNIFYMCYELINMGMVKNPKIINIGTYCLEIERQTYIRLFKHYIGVYA